MRDQLGRIPRPLAACAVLSLVGSLVAGAARAIEPFAHGIWLATYLFLVGFLAQVLLARGQAAMRAASASAAEAPPIAAQATLWNVGVVAVPLGVLVGARLGVVLGSFALLMALATFWQGGRRSESHIESWGRRGVGYVALIVFMAGSVLVGTTLAWDTPWL